jgi:tetratricopeptide (TPR) repeat protein
MSKLFSFCVMLLALAFVLSWTDEASANDPEAKARAQALFERGITAYKEARFKDAIDSFLDAHREYPSPTLSFNAARAYEKMGDNAGALRFYREYLRQAPDAQDKARVGERVADLEKKLVTRGVQQVTILSNVTGAQVIVDGRPVGVTPWTGEIRPGKHELKLRQAGYAEAKGEFQLPADRAIDFQLEMKPGETPVADATAGEKTSDTRDTSKDAGVEKKGIGPMTWVAFGVGVAALGGAVVFEQLRKASEDDVKTEETQVARHDAHDSMKSKQTTARVLAGVGAVAVLAGGVLLYFDLSGGSSEKTAHTRTHQRTRAGIGCGPLSCGATLSGHF